MLLLQNFHIKQSNKQTINKHASTGVLFFIFTIFTSLFHWIVDRSRRSECLQVASCQSFVLQSPIFRRTMSVYNWFVGLSPTPREIFRCGLTLPNYATS